MTSPSWLVATAGLAVALVVVTAGAGFALYRQSQQVEALEAELAETGAELAAAEAELEAAEDAEDPRGLLDDLLDGDLDGLLDGDLDELLDGGLDGLLDDDLDGLLDDERDAGLPDADELACLETDVEVPTAPADAPAEEQAEVIADAVEQLRGLTFDAAPPVDVQAPDAFEAGLVELLEDYTEEEAETDRARLAALGAVPEDIDMRALQEELLTGAAAGYYTLEDGDVVVRGGDDGALGAVARITLAHELLHAVTDQQLGLPSNDPAEVGSDAALANLSVTEGDAVLLQNQYAMAALAPEEQLGLAADPEIAQQQEALQEFPAYVQRELLFPYEDGYQLVCRVYLHGGWEAVDALYDDGPTTSAGVLDPARADEEPAEPPALGELAGGWEHLDDDTFGAAQWQWLLEAPGDDPDAALEAPDERVGGWDGGRIATWADGEASAVGVAVAQRDDAPDVCATWAEWHAAAFPDAADVPTEGDEVHAAEGDDRAGVVTCGDDGATVGLAPTLADARALAGSG